MNRLISTKTKTFAIKHEIKIPRIEVWWILDTPPLLVTVKGSSVSGGPGSIGVWVIEPTKRTWNYMWNPEKKTLKHNTPRKWRAFPEIQKLHTKRL